MRPIVIFGVLAWSVAAVPVHAQPPGAETMSVAAAQSTAERRAPGADLQSLLDYARERNVEYAAMRFEADAAAERVEPAGALPDPKLRIELQDITRMGERNATLDPSRTGQTKYLLMQDLPWFGKRDLREEVAAYEAEAARGLAQGSWTDLRALIKKAYIRNYFISRRERLMHNILDLMVRLEQIAQTRYANGLAPQQDAIRAQLEQTAMHHELIELESERRGIGAQLNALLNRPANALLAEPETLPPLPDAAGLELDALIERARRSNPQLFVESNRIRAAEKGRDLAYRNRYPDFSVGVAPTQSGDSIREWELMVELNIPLQQGTRRSQEREAGAMLAAARARHEGVGYRLVGEIVENLSAYAAATHSEHLIRTNLLPQSQLTFEAALAGYETGKVDFATLLDAQRAIDQARLNRLQAQAEQQTRLADIERLLGEEL